MHQRVSSVILALAVLTGFSPCQDAPTQEKPKEKPGYKVGDTVQDFTLKSIEGPEKSIKDHGKDKKFIVIDFWSPKCPACTAEEPRFAALDKKWREKGVQFLHIAPNKGDNRTDEGIAACKAGLKEFGIEFPALLDVDNKIADAFGAAVTPTVFILDASTLKIKYSGAVATGGRRDPAAAKNHVEDALTALLDGKEPAVTRTEPSG